MEECVLCNEVITNPVCMSCVETEMKVWLQERKPDLIEELKTKTFELALDLGETNCVLCKNNMSVCTFCYTQHIRSWLKEYPELLEEFKIFFSFNYFYK